ncbi:hypothetical protein ACWCQN_12885 [Streptomyces sp. NPDC001984]
MSPDDYDRLYAEARDETPFSNGDQGYGWMAANCDRCVHDKSARDDNGGEGCPLVLIALVGRTPAQWLCETEQQAIFADYTCTEFRGEDDDDPTPRPMPTPDGQGELLPREPFEGHRMLTPLPEDQAARDFRESIDKGLTEDLDAFTRRLQAAIDTARRTGC